MIKAVVLLSGGLDSTVILAQALANGRECHTISFDYGQTHRIELKGAEAIANHYRVSHQIILLDRLALKSSLTHFFAIDKAKNSQDILDNGKISTYVPGRNTLFLSYAMSIAECIEAQEIYFGSNYSDHAYPDCRPEYLEAMQKMMNLASKQACEGKPVQLITPLLKLDKPDIIRLGIKLNAPLHLTWSCYSPAKENRPCNECLACLLRQEAFEKINSDTSNN